MDLFTQQANFYKIWQRSFASLTNLGYFELPEAIFQGIFPHALSKTRSVTQILYISDTSIHYLLALQILKYLLTGKFLSRTSSARSCSLLSSNHYTEYIIVLLSFHRSCETSRCSFFYSHQTINSPQSLTVLVVVELNKLHLFSYWW